MSGYKRVTHTRHVWVLKWLGSQWGPCDPAVENPSKESKGLRFKFFILYPCVWYNFFFIFQDSKFYGPKTVLFYKNSWKPTVFIERDQGKGDLETMVMREVNRISKKSKKHFFSLKKKGYLKTWDLTFLWKTMIHIYENDITDQIRLWLAF